MRPLLQRATIRLPDHRARRTVFGRDDAIRQGHLPISIACASKTTPAAAFLGVERPRHYFDVEVSMFRISRAGNDYFEDVNNVPEIERAISSAELGRYHIDEFPLRPFRSGHTVRRWAIGIKRDDGSVVIEPDPWES